MDNSILKQADIQEVVIDGASGQNILASEMKDARIKKAYTTYCKRNYCCEFNL